MDISCCLLSLILCWIEDPQIWVELFIVIIIGHLALELMDL